jgi:hypothetical protein
LARPGQFQQHNLVDLFLLWHGASVSRLQATPQTRKYYLEEKEQFCFGDKMVIEYCSVCVFARLLHLALVTPEECKAHCGAELMLKVPHTVSIVIE